MNVMTVDSPEAITLSGTLSGAAGGPVEREARLLVAGEYPGKDLTVTEADLDALVAHFTGPVPVKVEHIDSPLDPLGQVVKLWREGRELRGRIAFPPAMAAFLGERGAAKLSCGLLKGPAWRLLEASLTLTPHVPTAALLSDGERAELAQLRAQRLDAEIARLKAGGKLAPAAEPFARALLGADGGALVTLADGGTEAAGAVFRRFLGAQPAVIAFGEAARARAGTTLSGGGAGVAGADPDGTEGGGEPELTAEQAAICRRLGVEPAEVARTLRDDRNKKGAL